MIIPNTPTIPVACIHIEELHYASGLGRAQQIWVTILREGEGDREWMCMEKEGTSKWHCNKTSCRQGVHVLSKTF